MDIGNLTKKLGIGFVFGVIVLAGLMLWGDVSQLKRSFVQFHWGYLPLILSFTLLGYAFRFWKWEVFLRGIGIQIRWKNSLLIFLSGFSMAITPGKAGEVLKSFLLKRIEQIEIARTAPIVLAERLTDLLAMVALAAWGASRFSYGRWVLGGTLVFLVILILILQNRSLSLWIIDKIHQLKWGKGIAEKLHLFYDSTQVILRFRMLFLTTSISILSWFFECVSLYFVLKGLGLGLEGLIVDAVYIFSFSSIAGAISMLPGGLGVAETSMTGMMIGIGMEEGQAIVATLMGRFGTLWFGVLIGLLVLATWGRKYMQKEGRNRI